MKQSYIIGLSVEPLAVLTNWGFLIFDRDTFSMLIFIL